MKIAISSQGTEETSLLDSRFGRCRYFYIYETDSKGHEIVDNQANLSLVQGAGIQTAQLLVEKDIVGVITGFCGPKAFKVLNESSIKVFSHEGGTVQDAIRCFFDNKLTEIFAPNN